MACHTPVIASSAGALPEVVADAGLIVNPKNVAAISDAMKQINDSSPLRTKLVAKGKDRLQFYTWELAARRVVQVLEELQC